MKIKCTNCGRTIAEGQKPAPVTIKCPKCKVVNDLNKEDKTKPFAERLQLLKKRHDEMPDYEKKDQVY